MKKEANISTKIAVFQGKKVRKIIFQNEWWFSVVDVVQALTDQQDDQTARKYWNKLAQRLREEGSELVIFCHQLKLESADGKTYETDLNFKNLLLQSVTFCRQLINKINFNVVKRNINSHCDKFAIILNRNNIRILI